MRALLQFCLVGILCVATAGIAVNYLLGTGARTGWLAASHLHVGAKRVTAPSNSSASAIGQHVLRQLPRNDYEVALDRFEDGGYETAMRFMAPIRDPGSLQELREAVRGRSRRGISLLRADYAERAVSSPLTSGQKAEKAALEQAIGFLYMYDGKFLEASSWLERALQTSRDPAIPAAMAKRATAVLGIVSLRRGEIENCLECIGPSSCIFPIAPEAIHQNTSGSRGAIRWFTAYLEQSPRDLRIIWLLNIAYMTLGEYPDKVPAQYRLPVDLLQSGSDVGRFENVASRVGLSTRGPNLAGGSVFDDFTGDGLPDLFTTSLDADLGASLYVNLGTGAFEDRSASAGLGDQIYALNITRGDYDNDGNLDVLLLRGGWEKPLRLSLLRNRGYGVFEDVTNASGLGQPIATESAAWGDYDNDGWIDLFVCGEYLSPGSKSSSGLHDLRNRCRLYHNQHDGTFVDVASRAGVSNDRCAKGSAWGDYDGDGLLDLFVSNMGQPCCLYRNDGDGRFHDVAQELGVTGPDASFACWFWDFDNDGFLDLYVNDYRARVAEVLCSAMGMKLNDSSRPRLYRNLGSAGFRDVSREVGLDRAMAPMGANFGDFDNDGFLDMYLGTGDMSYEGLDINLLFRNVGGERFEDVTVSSGTGHLQKGHGVSFADWDGDGDLDLFVELGGATPGDQAYNALFQNPGHGRHWLKVKLVGTVTNRAAIGARIRADVKDANGQIRSIYRTVGNNSSFGGNSLVETIGLLDASRVATLVITWPTSKSTQTYHDIPADKLITVKEGSPSS
jgi:FG-GAP-like repeat/ASPIC and UnbV